MRRGSIRFKNVILHVFHTIFSAFVRSRPSHNPVLLLSKCSSTNSARCSVRFRSTCPASINFLHTALLSQHYANHFPEPLTWSYLQFSPAAFAKDRQHFSLLAVAWIIHLQLLTFFVESTPGDYFAVPFVRVCHSAHFCPRPYRLDVKFRNHHARSVSLTALHFMWTLPTEPESPPRTVSSRTPPPVYAQNFSVSENNYAVNSHSNLLTISFWHYCVFASRVFSFSIWLSRCTSTFKN